jgi:3-hydroxy-9,10-secoandrosta-1,3,5(10)-triene-9,17-dione monooxygenase reductase component
MDQVADARSVTNRPSAIVLDASTVRDAMARLPMCAVVVATMDGQRPVGMVVGTFTSVSLAPLLVGFLADRGSATLVSLLDADRISCTLLDESHLDVVDQFRRPAESRFEGLSWSVDTQHGAPVFIGTPLVVFARPSAQVDAGDRILALFEVIDIRAAGPTRPLVFCAGRMTRLEPGQLVGGDVWQLGRLDES